MSNALPDRPTPVSQSIFAQTYGGALACCQVMLVFYGLSVLQSYLYFIRYEKDRIYLKLLVLALFCLSTTHAILVCHTIWHYLVFSYTDVALLTDGEWSVYAATGVGAATCFLIQCFFARMIFTRKYLTTYPWWIYSDIETHIVVTHGRWRMVIGMTMMILILAQLGFGIALTVKAFLIWQIFLLKEAVYVAMIPLVCVRMAADAVTASTLCVVLYDATTDFTSSVKLVKTLIMYAVNRFVLTTVVVIIQTIFLIIRPGDIWAMVLEFITIHIYVNSLLATVNARDHLRDIGKNPSTDASARSPHGTISFIPAPRSRFNDTLHASSGNTVSEQMHVDFGVLDRSVPDHQCFELSNLESKPAVVGEPLV